MNRLRRLVMPLQASSWRRDEGHGLPWARPVHFADNTDAPSPAGFTTAGFALRIAMRHQSNPCRESAAGTILAAQEAISHPIQIRMGGYGPPTTTFSRGLKFIGDRLAARFGDRVDVKYVWNVMDLGYRTEDLWWLVEHGLLTLAYQSSSGLTDRIPELGIADLPFLFESNDEARAAIDGPLGAYMAAQMEAKINYRVVGFFENGFRHVSNRLRPIRHPDDFAGMRIRTLNSRIHEQTFESLGATPVRSGLKEAIEAMAAGRVDAQENPLANTVTYGAHKFHHFHTLSRHFYISRPIFINRTAFDGWPADLREAMREAAVAAVAHQRDLAVAEEELSGKAILDHGCEMIELDAGGRAAFRAAVKPVYGEALRDLGDGPFAAIPQQKPRLFA